MATIRDVAAMAGVSIATVSNYLNQTRPVSREASARIQKAVDSLQYSQNLSAKSLRSNFYSDIGVILPDFDDSYYVQMFQGIEQVFQNGKYYVNLSFSYNDPELEQNCIRNFMKKNVCGLILVSCQPDNWKFYYEHFTSDHRPLVLVDHDIRSLDANFVSFDNYSLIRKMTRRLLEQNYRRIILVCGSERYYCEADCIRGFRDAFSEYDLPVDTSGVIQTTLHKEDAFRHTIQLLQSNTPDAIITTSEPLASGIIEGLLMVGCSPADIPVLTLGEEHWNLFTHSFASDSAARPAIKLGQTAARLLVDQLEHPLTKENEKIIVEDSSHSGHRFLAELPPCRPSMPRPEPDRSIRILMVDTPQVHALLGLVKNFETRTGIRADITIQPHHHLYQTILDNCQDPPDKIFDVILYDIPWLPSLASAHILENITQELRDIDLGIFLPDCLQYFSTFNNRQYGIPFMYAPQIFYYRKDLFENSTLKKDYERQTNLSLRPPLTIKEYNTLADFFTNRTRAVPYGLSVPAAYDECLAPEIYMRLRAFGGKLFDSLGNVCLDSPAALKAYISLLRSCRLAKPNYRSSTDVSIVQDFLAGETAMLISYPSFLTDIVDLRKNNLPGSIGYHHIPGRSPLLGGWSLGINSCSAKKADAFSFLKWTCDEQIANYFALLGGQTAITSAYTNDELIKLYPWLPLYLDAYPYTRPTVPPNLGRHASPSQGEIDAIVCRGFYRFLDEEAEISDILAGTQNELEQLIKAYRKK